MASCTPLPGRAASQYKKNIVVLASEAAWASPCGNCPLGAVGTPKFGGLGGVTWFDIASKDFFRESFRR
eukprot:scaffold7074_cov85-Skeletonema_dohrnii-CCMP3373.AAC.2